MGRVILNNVSKVYPGGVRAVDGIDLEIADEEFLVLVGPSGCGKSTTLRLVAGLEVPSGGTIAIGDRVVNAVAPKDRDVAMVFQHDALYPHLTVYGNLAFGLQLRRRELGLSKADIDKMVRKAAALLGITDLLDRRPQSLSGGQRQRVAVGRAIVRRPAVFLFDEPLSNLDARLRLELRSEIKRLQRRLQTTTVYVTHDQEEAMTLGDRVVVMKDGVIQQCAAPLTVYERPANRFVAGFVGMPPMNFVEGRLVAEAGGLVFDSGEGMFRLPDSHNRVLSRYVNRDMTLGLRPDAIGMAVGGSVDGRGDCLRARVTQVEPLGDRKDVYFARPGGLSLVARMESRRPLAEGTETVVTLDMSRAHVFERGELGMNVTATISEEAGR